MDPGGDPFALLALLDFTGCGSGGDPSLLRLPGPEFAALRPDQPLPRRLVLVFPKLDANGKASRAVTVGSCQLVPPTMGVAGTYALQWANGVVDENAAAAAGGGGKAAAAAGAAASSSSGFTVSSMGGALAAGGAQVEVQFSFTQSVREEDLAKGPVRITQWIERTLRCTLTGGYVPKHPTAPPDHADYTQVVEIVLRVFALK